ncbi:MAG: hypothetical protein JRG76_05060 [Deltaproteobacteria bacterium]|nr:hypothetical protein [Deltaproteobacteria bacterium]MBW2413861.1 hypothetical protein [Deltaproteobacteria bacterium]
MYAWINAPFTGFFDLLLWPFSRLPEAVQICVMALPATVVMLLAFRFFSNQQTLDRSKDRIKAHLLELWLYRDDMGVTMRAQGNLLVYNLRYLGALLLPMAVMALPFVLLLAQVEARFALRSLHAGESAILSVQVDPGLMPSALPVSLDLPAGLVRETPPLRVDGGHSIAWRIRGDAAGEYDVGVRVGDVAVTKRVVVEGNGAHISPWIQRASDPWTLLYPLESPLPAEAGVRAVSLDYPRGRGEFLDLSSAGWIFIAATFVFGFAFRGAFGVTF